LRQSASGAGKVNAISGHIIGGEDATLGQFPWQVWLHVDSTWSCGGSLILKDWVLTAGHCLGYIVPAKRLNFNIIMNFRSSHKVTIGSITISSLSPGGFRVVSTTSYLHEQYSDTTLNNDIALIKLPEEVTLTGMMNKNKKI
jgi:secreted trypsin-like serine protease